MLQPDGAQSRPAAWAHQRKVVHDLRNLFAIIGAGKSLLERDPALPQRQDVLTAIEEATREGARLTTELLANRTERADTTIVDLDERLADLAPMIRVLTDAHVDFKPSSRKPALVRMVSSDFDAVVLEIVSNAAAAGASRIAIRTRTCGENVWMLICDDGCGMSPATLTRASGPADLGKAHGTGLYQMRQFMDRSGGHLRIRSRLGGGTQVGLVFPALLPIMGDMDKRVEIPSAPMRSHLGACSGRVPSSIQ